MAGQARVQGEGHFNFLHPEHRQRLAHGPERKYVFALSRENTRLKLHEQADTNSNPIIALNYTEGSETLQWDIRKEESGEGTHIWK